MATRKIIIERKAQMMSDILLADTGVVADKINNDELELIEYIRKMIIKYMKTGKKITKKQFMNKCAKIFTYTEYKKALEDALLGQKKKNASSLHAFQSELKEIDAIKALKTHILMMSLQYYQKYVQTINYLDKSKRELNNG